MNQEILQAAQDLAELIKLSPEYNQMQEQEELALQDEALQEEYRGYTLLRQQLQELMAEDAPDQEQITRLSQEIDAQQESLQAMESMEKLNGARQAFSVLMERVNMIMQGVLSPESDEDDVPVCGAGGCAGCSGCGAAR